VWINPVNMAKSFFEDTRSCGGEQETAVTMDTDRCLVHLTIVFVNCLSVNVKDIVYMLSVVHMQNHVSGVHSLRSEGQRSQFLHNFSRLLSTKRLIS